VNSYAYWAFLSYSRQDAGSARWVHRTLERYVVPRRLVGRQTPCGPAPRRFRPIFRDRADVAAGGELHSSIEHALANSAYLIVICSPSAVASTWVAEEINCFRRLHGDGRFLAVISADAPTDKDLCFPQALLSRGSNDATGRWEPIAADLRPGGDGRRLVRLRVIAGMLGIGLDELVRRDDHRRRRRLIAATAASLGGMALMATLAVAALLARNEARAQRAHAESLIEFMLTDLRKKLEQSGKLDLMDGVGTEALSYYESQNSHELDGESLSRRARALRLMGEIKIQRGDLNDALAAFQQAAVSTGELLARSRSPDNPQLIFNHAQDVFWMGEVARQRGDLPSAEASFLEYRRLAQSLVEIDPGSDDWRAEIEYAQTALGVLFLQQGRAAEAVAAFQQTLTQAEWLAHRHSDDLNRQIELGQGHAWLADALQKQGRLADTRTHRESELAIYRTILSKEPTMRQAKYSTIVALQVLGRLAMIEGNVSGGLDKFGDAAARAEALLAEERNNMDLTSVAAIAHVDLGEALLAAGKMDEARAAQKRADALLVVALAHDNSVESWGYYRDRAHLLEAALASGAGHHDEAIKIDQTVISRLEPNVKGESNTEPLWLLERAHVQLGNEFAAVGRLSEARTEWSAVTQRLTGPTDSYEPKLLLVLKAADERLGYQASAERIARYVTNLSVPGIGSASR
jgi:eukaryotic-like serine/threonine-protein kinase